MNKLVFVGIFARFMAGAFHWVLRNSQCMEATPATHTNKAA